jgi:quinol monooxygenase YgiN
MIVYEVNLWIKNNIFSDYQSWLNEHILEMLQFQGFIEAQLLSDTDDIDDHDQDNKKLTVQYLIESLKDLKHYFDHNASSMREKAIEKFGDRFKAERRILDVQHFYSK